MHRQVPDRSRAAPPEHVYESLTGYRVHDRRHTCLTTWLNNGVPPARVAESAGSSVSVLLATYTRCITGRRTELQQRIERPGSPSGLTPTLRRAR
ncbi:hypothetical protein [Streptomyces sp. NPDC048473]|uniref:hypothetical protein n=1 Tax=unclassified Streptomyces TaxID=2593676 RepID=UPI003721767B